MILWLLEKSVLDQIENASNNGFMPSSDQQDKFLAAFGEEQQVIRTGSDATIKVNGTLTSKPSIFAMIFGGGNSTYSGIKQQIEAADADPSISKIVFEFDSPGGEAGAEMIDTALAIRNAKKPTLGIVGNMAASAAFGLASQVDELIAVNEMSFVGSVGTVTTRKIDKSKVTITSSDAPLKRPDASTEEGVAAIQKTIDKIEEVFVRTIAEGRGTTIENVRENYGKGDIVLANEALAKNMIDSISNSSNNSNSQTASANNGDMQNQEESKMDKVELKRQHADTYQAVLDEGMETGAAKERSRVNALLKMGKAHNAMDIAQTAIASGKSIHDDEVMADFLTAKTNVADQDSRQADDKNVSAAVDDTAEQTDDSEAEAVSVVDAALAKFGGK